MTIESSIFIKADIAKVYAMFTDIKNISKNISGIISSEILEKPEFQVGTKWKETREMFGQEASETMWVTSVKKNASYAVDAESNGSKYHSEYKFTKKDGGTQVDLTFTGTPVSLGAKLMTPLTWIMKNSIKKLFHADMVELKAKLEK